jgi:hypothetical protein
MSLQCLPELPSEAPCPICLPCTSHVCHCDIQILHTLGCASAGVLLLSVRGLRLSGKRGRSRGMVMPKLSHQNEQFYPHGLKSLSKGMILFRTDFRLFHYMHTNPATRGGKSASSLILYCSSHASEDDLHQTRHGKLRHALLQSTIQVA